MEGHGKRKGLNGKRRKTLLKGSFSEGKEGLGFTFLTKSEPIYFLLNYKFLSNLLGCIIKNCGKKISGKKIYPASGGNDLVVFENNSAKIADVLPC